MVDALLCSSAAPFYFKAVKRGDYKFVDGGLGATNPTLNALIEVGKIARTLIDKKAEATRTPIIIVSLGTGLENSKSKPHDKDYDKKKTKNTKISAPVLETLNLVIGTATDSEGIHKSVSQ